MHSLWTWGGLIALILSLLALDLGVFNRKAHEVSLKEAAWTSLVWILLSCAFGGWVYLSMGAEKGLQFFAGYIIEKAMSVDNLFVFVFLFGFFKVPRQYHHRVLFWGILGALILRGVFIGVGAAAVAQWHWLLYGFGILLIWTAWKLLRSGEDDGVEPEKNFLVKALRKYFPITEGYREGHFAVQECKSPGSPLTWMLTPLAVVLAAVETTDILFATDSVPAIFSVSNDPFILFSSNVFAILGLRALYFLIENIIRLFAYLKPALALVLAFVGVKMLLVGEHIHVPFTDINIPWFNIDISIGVSLAVIVVTLTVAVIASIFFPPKEKSEEAKDVDPSTKN